MFILLSGLTAGLRNEGLGASFRSMGLEWQVPFLLHPWEAHWGFCGPTSLGPTCEDILESFLYIGGVQG